MLATLYQLGITPSNNRPRVSNDNPYAESLFKTLKYRPNYQPKGFETLEEAREWVSLFVKWYNYDHHHSGLNFLTPYQRRSGLSDKILSKRKEVKFTKLLKQSIRNAGMDVQPVTGVFRILYI